MLRWRGRLLQASDGLLQLGLETITIVNEGLLVRAALFIAQRN